MKYIDDFIAYHREWTGCPTSFLTWAALFTVSGAMGFNQFLRTGRKNIRPNLWILLLAKSSMYKSTSVNTCGDILRTICAEHMAFDEFSQASLIRHMAEQPHHIFIYDEAESFLTMLENKWNGGLRAFFMKIFSGVSHWKEINGQSGKGERFEVIDPYICWAGASTINQMSSYANGSSGDILSGFLPRFIFVPQLDSPKPYPICPPDDPIKFKALQTQLNIWRERSKMEREYRYSSSALKIFTEWYYRMDARIKKGGPDMEPFFFKMRDIHIHKICMIHAFMRDSSIIDDEDIDFAVPLLYQIEDSWKTLLPSIVDSQKTQSVKLVEQFIKQMGVVTRTQLSKEFQKIDTDSMNLMLRGMEEAGKIARKKIPADGIGRPTMEIRWIVD